MTAESSILCRRLTALWLGFRSLWHQSALGLWFTRRREDLQRAGKNSRAVDFAVRQGALRRGWEGSILHKVLSAVLNIPVFMAKGLYKAAKPLWDGSYLYRGMTALGRGAWVLLGLFALLMLVAPHERWDNLYAFLIAAGVLGLFAVGCSNRENKLEVGRLGPYFTFYLIFITLGLAASLSIPLSLRFYLFHLTCFFIVLVAVSAIHSYRQLKVLLVCVALGLAVSAIYGCYQGYVGVEVVASQQDLNLNEGMPGRVYSFFNNPNNYAEVLVMFLPLTGALALNAEGWRGRVLGLLGTGAGLAAIGMTYSRSSWLGLALAVAVMMALLNWRLLPGLLVAALLAIPILPETIWNRILTIGNMQDSSARYRVAIYEDTGRLLRDYGLTGTGLGSDVMKRIFQHYPTLYDGNYPIHTHNNYLQMWGETGILGLLAFLALVAGHVKEGLGAFKRADRRLRRIIAAALGSFLGILSVGLVEYTWFYPRNMFLFWVLFGVIAACIKLAGQERE